MLGEDGIETLDEVCLAELLATAATLEANPLPIAALRADDFELPACRKLAARIKNTLDDGVGFAIINGMPLDDVDQDVAKKLYWLLLSLLGRPVAQKWDGEMVYDVTDTGQAPTAGSGVRSSKTRSGQIYHTDNSFNLPPEYVGLLCFNPAMEGGQSGLISFDSVYNRLLSQRPEVLPRLYQPFYFDRQREHAPADELVSFHPVFEYDGEVLKTRLATSLIRHGHTVAQIEMDDETNEALEVLDEVMEEEDFGKTFEFERGQIQIVNNRRIGHRRTGFVDWPEPERKRHLVRLWLRNQGRPFYLG